MGRGCSTRQACADDDTRCSSPASARAGRVNQRWLQLRDDCSKPSRTATLDLPGQAGPRLPGADGNPHPASGSRTSGLTQARNLTTSQPRERQNTTPPSRLALIIYVFSFLVLRLARAAPQKPVDPDSNPVSLTLSRLSYALC